MGRQLTGHGGQSQKLADGLGQPFHVNGNDTKSLCLAFSNQTKDNIYVEIERLTKILKSHLE
jgi:DNA-binding transcriptional MocR family regulator